MKLFKNWDDPIQAFVFFLAKDALAQCRRMRKLYKQCKQGEVEVLHQYNTQCGVAMQTNTIYNIAKFHFKLDSFNRKHIIKSNESQKFQEGAN